jgi:AraC-like DNA-binding protein
MEDAEKDKQKNFWSKGSQYEEYGIYYYNYLNVNFMEKFVSPADPNIHIFYVISGSCNYEGIDVKQGDVFLFGMNKSSVSSEMLKIELMVITVDYEFIYKISGLKPAQYCEKAMLLAEENKITKIIKNIHESDLDQWAIKFEESLKELFSKKDEIFAGSNFSHAIAAERMVRSHVNTTIQDIYREVEISARHLQRQFLDFFGITLREYFGIVRFNKAFQTMYEKDLVTTAVETGYYDQAHLSREFQNRAGNSPNQWKKGEMFDTYKGILSGIQDFKRE